MFSLYSATIQHRGHFTLDLIELHQITHPENRLLSGFVLRFPFVLGENHLRDCL